MNFNQVKTAIENNDIVYVADETENTDITVKEIRIIGFHWDSVAGEHYAVGMSGRQYVLDELEKKYNDAKDTKISKLIAKYQAKIDKLQSM